MQKKAVIESRGSVSYIRELRQLPPGVRRFFMSEPFLGAAFGLFQLLFNLHMLAYGVTEVEIGTILAAGTLMMAAAAVPAGLTADRIGRKPVLVTGLLLITAGHAAAAFGTTLAAFMGAQLLISVGMAMMVSTEIPLLYNYCRNPRQQTQTYNLMFALFTMFIGLGTLAGGYLPALFGEGGGAGYQQTMLVMAACTAVTAVSRMFLPAETREKQQGWGWSSIASQRPSRNTMKYIGFSLIAGAAHGLLIPYYNVILAFRFEWTDTMIAWLLTGTGVIASLTAFAAPVLLDKWGVRKVSVVLLIQAVLTTFLLATLLPLAVFLLFFLFRHGSFLTFVNVIEGKAMEATKDSQRSLHASLRMIGRNLGTAAGSYAAGFLLAAQAYGSIFLWTAVLIAASGIYFYWVMLPSLEDDLSLSSAERFNQGEKRK